MSVTMLGTRAVEVSGAHRIAHLDGWRGLAIVSVLIAHFGTTNYINLGRFGVELFFVLSGRLMAELLFVREMPLKIFFFRRFSRIYPALFVFCALLGATAPWRAGDPQLLQFLSSVTLTANYAQFWVGRSPVLDHIWSLCIEEHTYILLGLLAFADRMRKLPIIPILMLLAATGIAIGAMQTAHGYDYYAVYWRSDVRGASILLGAIAFLALRHGVPRQLSTPFVPIALGGLGLLLNLNAVANPVKYSLGTACLAASLVLVQNAPALLRHVLTSPLLVHFGVFSYSVYLWQQPFAKSAGMGPTCLVLAFAAALASYYLVERPGREFLNRSGERA